MNAKLICKTVGDALIFKTALRVKLFFSSSHKDISWDEAEKK